MNRFSCNSLLSEWELSKAKCEYYRSYQISNSYYRLQLWWQWCWWSSVEQSDKLVKLVCKSKTAAELAPELVSNWLPSPAMRTNYIAGVDNAKSTTYPNIFCCPQRLQEHPWACPFFFVPFCYFLVTFSAFIAWIPKHILYWIYSADVHRFTNMFCFYRQETDTCELSFTLFSQLWRIPSETDSKYQLRWGAKLKRKTIFTRTAKEYK